ncbi:MAG: MMPL family transporter [Syntrophales bacterium]|nr:MMPL family transporter [Syntrophales bacterium]MDD5641772.1 MMPL family transporter [Syntrophales bacterium]
MSENSKSFRTCKSLIRGLQRFAWPIIAVALVLAGLSVYYSATHLAFRTNRSDLVASDQKLIARSEQIDKAFGSHDGLIVVVENGSRRNTIAFAEALAQELRRYPRNFPEFFYRLDPDKFKQWALLYLEPQELAKIKNNLVDNRQFLNDLAARPNLAGFFQVINEGITRSMIGHLFTEFLEEGKGEEKLPDLSVLNTTLRQLQQGLAGEQAHASPFQSFFPGELADLSQQGYLLTENDKYLLFLITPEEDGYATSTRNLALLREIVAKVKTRFPHIKAGVTGPMALEADEMNGAMKDITLATWLSLMGQMLLLIIFLRSLKRPLMECVVLITGLCLTFGVATLVVGHLNLLSMIFAPLMLGLTIDYGIHWYCRLEEEQKSKKRCTLETLGYTLQRAAPGIIYAAVAAAFSFLPLVFTGFKGLAEMGQILTLGMLIMLVVTLVLLPALVMVSEKCRPAQAPHESGPPRPFLSLSWKRPGVIAVLGLGMMALGGLSLSYVKFDLNPLHLQNQGTESVVWEMKLLKDSRYSTAYGALTANSLAELEAKSRKLKELPTVSHVESVLSFFPDGVEAKRAILNELKPVFSQINIPGEPSSPSSPQALAGVLGRINFKLSQARANLENAEDSATKTQILEANSLLNRVIPLLDVQRHPESAARLHASERRFFVDLHNMWALLKENLSAAPPGLQDLPPEVKRRFVSSQGELLLRVFPSLDIWEQEPLDKFVRDIQSVDPEAVGDPVLLHHFNLAFRNACLWAAGMALAAITIMLLLLFRSLKLTLLALLPLLVGTGWTLNMMWLLDLPFNQANVLFLPLILGEGIEFGIIILVRWQMEESTRAITLPASTAKGVALAALTTTLGFGSLMISGHRGVFSLGLLATVGSLSVLLASLSVLPAFLRLLEKRHREIVPALPQLQVVGRWLNQFLGWKEAR